jgi:hypothetical protein
MAFIGVKNGRIVVRNDVKRLKGITYGFIVYVKEKGFQGLLELVIKRLRKRLQALLTRQSHYAADDTIGT